MEVHRGVAVKLHAKPLVVFPVFVPFEIKQHIHWFSRWYHYSCKKWDGSSRAWPKSLSVHH